MEAVELLKAKQGGKSLRSLGKEIRVSAAFLSQVLNGRKPPGPKVLAYLGLEKLPPTYRKARKPK